MNIEDINRHWLVWLKSNFDYSNLSLDQINTIQKHIENDLPFVCARFTPSQMDRFNLGYCCTPESKNKKPKRYSVQANKEDINKYCPPLFISKVTENLPRQYSDKLNLLINMFTDAGLSEPGVFGSYLWQSITQEPHIRQNSDLDLIVYTDSLDSMCVCFDIFNKWELMSNIKIDCEFCIENSIFFSSEEFFDTSKQVIIKTRNLVDLIHKKELFKKLQSIRYSPNLSSMPISKKNHLSTQLAFLACKALYAELISYPKPGLVSFYDTGSHKDMDRITFTKSISTLYEYFTNIADAVMFNCSFQDMVDIGIKAEQKMLTATNDINTHKGAIFSLGLLVAATVKTLKNNIPLTPESIQNTLLNSWSNDIINHPIPNTTHGRKVVNSYNSNGILKEAADGFPIIFNIALPCLQHTLKMTENWNCSLIQTFFKILSVLDDTNILFRGGKEALSFVRNEAASFLKNNGVYNQNWYTTAKRIHQSFIEKQLSPGGCADMLACTVFLSYLKQLLASVFGKIEVLSNRNTLC